MTQDSAPPPWRLTLLAAAVALLVTAAIAVVPFVSYAYRSADLHIVLSTADALTAGLVGYLVYGRYRQTSRQRDLLLAGSMAVLAVANLPLDALPEALAPDDGVGGWAALTLRTLGALVFAVAALTPASATLGRRAGKRVALALAAAAAWLAVIGVLLGRELSLPVPATTTAAGVPQLDGHPAVVAMQAVGVLLYAVAAWAFTRAAAAEGDDFLRWVGAAAALAAGARLSFALYPSLYTDYLYTGDLLRFGFYLLLLVGAAREIRSYWSARVVAGVARGRHDAAREIGDVLLPRLRYASARLDGLVGSHEAARAVREAIEESERVLAATRDDLAGVLAAEPLQAALHAALAPVTGRYGTAVDVRVDQGAAPEHLHELLVTLAGEAVTLGARDAGARSALVEVREEPLRLVVHDDGVPADEPSQERSACLDRIRSRAAEHGGVLTVMPTATGTALVVQWL